MDNYLAEFVGTMLLIILGGGVNANVSLNKTYANGSDWIVIGTGWGLAVAIAVYAVGWISGAHINPAVTLGLFAIGEMEAAQVPGYLIAQFAGAFVGAIVVWLAYLAHWPETPDPATKRGVFCTSPAIRKTIPNLICEIIGSAVLVFGVLTILRPENLNPDTGWNVGFGPLLVGLLVVSIGLSLGGTTGYAINPARDLGPRLAHAILPIKNKADSDWGYAWIPIVGPIIGGIGGAFLFKAIGLWPAIEKAVEVAS